MFPHDDFVIEPMPSYITLPHHRHRHTHKQHSHHDNHTQQDDGNHHDNKNYDKFSGFTESDHHRHASHKNLDLKLSHRSNTFQQKSLETSKSGPTDSNGEKLGVIPDNTDTDLSRPSEISGMDIKRLGDGILGQRHILYKRSTLKNHHHDNYETSKGIILLTILLSTLSYDIY